LRNDDYEILSRRRHTRHLRADEHFTRLVNAQGVASVGANGVTALWIRHFSLELPGKTTPEAVTWRRRVEAVGNPKCDFELVDITPSEVSGMRLHPRHPATTSPPALPKDPYGIAADLKEVRG